MSHARRNAAAYNRFVAQGSQFAKVATDEELLNPLGTLDSRGWLPESVAGYRVLCLAAAGGWQSILYAAAGAEVTVVDVSREMLRLDEREARRRGFSHSVRLVEASMERMPMLEEDSFDIVHQPVSTCYIPEVAVVYGEIARLLKEGGVYVSQHKNPLSLQVTHRTSDGEYVVGLDYYRNGALPDVPDRAYRETGTVEYRHRLEDLVGGLGRAGMVIEDLTEPFRADPAAAVGQRGHRARFIPPYLRIKARRHERKREGRNATLWTP